MIVGRVLGTANLYRVEQDFVLAEALEASTETCHVLPDITGGPEVWHYKDVIVCDVCERAWFVDTNTDHLYRGPYVFWNPVRWYHFRLNRVALEILDTARRQREEGFYG